MTEAQGTARSFDEWSRLREVIIGSSADLEYYDIDRSFATFYFENIYQPLSSKGRPRGFPRSKMRFPRSILDELNEDLTEFVTVVEQFGAKVLRPAFSAANVEIRTPYWKSRTTPPLNIRDQCIILGTTIVETAPHVRGRIHENDALKPIFNSYFAGGSSWISMPRPTLGRDSIDISYLLDSGYEPQLLLPGDDSSSLTGLGHEIILDGAQCIRFGKHVIVNVANHNHRLGFTWLTRTLGAEFTFIPVYRLADSHIDSLVLPLRPGLLLIRNSGVARALPQPLQSWDRIVAPAVSEARFPVYTGQLANLASKYIDMNVLSLDEATVVVNSLYPELIAELEGRRFTVIPVRHRHRRLFGGGFHCFSLDCVRDGEAETYL